MSLHTFGDERQPEVMSQRDDGSHDGGIVAVGHDVLHERTVDLEPIHRKTFEIAPARVAGVEIVERDLHAEIVELAKHRMN